jgi:hypothetical protein
LVRHPAVARNGAGALSMSRENLVPANRVLGKKESAP